MLCRLALDSASVTFALQMSRSHDDDLCPLCHHDIRGRGGGDGMVRSAMVHVRG